MGAGVGRGASSRPGCRFEAQNEGVAVTRCDPWGGEDVSGRWSREASGQGGAVVPGKRVASGHGPTG
ncbi:hypothetical protein E2C01_059518 [Portunus trituberculatus]|uniref:Uncharacterized protein n=1 Tax=Portunus trituberculatus TaxID=210409 RepID=A0A5B7H9A1_PORTR|nr:hypothetical protein [Portunus trituberculatus]